MRDLIMPLALPILRFATRSYITGPEIADAMRLADAAAGQGLNATICYWNDGKESPRAVVDQHLRLLDSIRNCGLDADLAVKIPALWDDRELTSQVIAYARRQHTHVMFDSHAPAQSDLTFEMLEQLGPEGVGCAIPGRWTRSIADAERAVELGVDIRVIKGQWPDPVDPGMDLRQGFLRVIDVVAGRARHVRVATHDAPLARDAIRRLQAAGTACEVELLFPFPIEAVEREAKSAGVATRLYIPFGTAWLPYSISRAARQPRVLLWLLRDILNGRRLRLPSNGKP